MLNVYMDEAIHCATMNICIKKLSDYALSIFIQISDMEITIKFDSFQK